MPIPKLCVPSSTPDGFLGGRHFTANSPRLNTKQMVFQLGDEAPRNSEFSQNATRGLIGSAPLQDFRARAKPFSPSATPRVPKPLQLQAQRPATPRPTEGIREVSVRFRRILACALTGSRLK